MNKHYIASLFDESIKTVKVKFDTHGKAYTYKTKLDLKCDDQVIVDVGEILKIATVSKVDNEVDIDQNSNIEYKWIVQKIDTTEYEKQKEEEKIIFDKINKKIRLLHREQAKKTFIEMGFNIE